MTTHDGGVPDRLDPPFGGRFLVVCQVGLPERTNAPSRLSRRQRHTGKWSEGMSFLPVNISPPASTHCLFCCQDSSIALAPFSGVLLPEAISVLTSLKTRPVSGPSTWSMGLSNHSDRSICCAISFSNGS